MKNKHVYTKRISPRETALLLPFLGNYHKIRFSLQENLNLEQSDPTAIERLQEEKKEFAKTLKWEEGVVNVGRWEIAPTGIITGLLLID